MKEQAKEERAIFKMKKARIALQRKAYFTYGILFYSTYKLMEKDDPAMKIMPTAYADQLGNIVVNPDFIADLDQEMVEMILCHEAYHQVLMHPLRAKGKIPFIWNIAADLKVSQYLGEGGYAIPDGFIQPPTNRDTWKMNVGTTEIVINDVSKKNAEQIYYEVLHQLQDKGQNIPTGKVGRDKGKEKGEEEGHDSNDQKDGGDQELEKARAGLPEKSTGHMRWGEGSEEELREKAKMVRQRIAEAYTSAKKRGSMPGNMELAVQNILQGKISWKQYIRKMVIPLMPHTPSFRLPHKKSHATGVYLPHVEKRGGEVLVHIDTSASTIGELSSFLGEIINLARQCQPLKMEIIDGDTEVYNRYVIENSNIAKIKAIKPKGGGGTDHRPVFEYVSKEMPRAKLLICFTDGYTRFPEKKVPIDTLWVVTKDGKEPSEFPFGRAIKMK